MQLIKEQPEKTPGEKFSSGCFISCLSWYFLWNKGPLCIFKQIGLILIIFQTQHSCHRDAANILYVRIICRSSQWRCSNLSGWKEETWKKIQAWTGIEPMTSAIPVQRSNQLSYQANWELVNWEFVLSRRWRINEHEYMKFIYLNCG